MPYELSIESGFAAAHALRGYEGECERVHGHNFRVIARFTADGLDDVGIAFDFKELSAGLDEITGRLDHTDLSENDFLEGRNATAENLAELIYKALAARFADAPAEVRSVTVYESARYGATYYE
ncbi:MAG: 6-carboxytetrahydropterin synthase [Candidatus Coatesbacteria bacterium]|nr:MAG: 6-carboxytetrahydropterin synthase [Candidatus Coatesbacteria bacterium]